MYGIVQHCVLRCLDVAGEELFALKKTEYPELENTRKEVELLQKLYGLYRDVMNKMEDWKTILWSQVR